MTKPKKMIQVPYDQRGGLMHFPETHYDWTNVERDPENPRVWKSPPVPIEPDWRDNAPFKATLTLKHTHRGRSAAYFVWADETGAEFPMFISDMADLACSLIGIGPGGVVVADWIVAKRGQNYGVRLALPSELGEVANA